MAERWQVTTMNYSHDALVDQIIARPAATNAELGAMFGRTAGWVCLVKGSDMFNERLAARRSEIQDPILIASIEERFNAMTKRSLEVLVEKLSRPVADIPDNLALQAAALGAKGLGVGGFSSKPAPPPEAPVEDRIVKLAARLSLLGTRPAPNLETVDVPFRDVSLPSSPRPAGEPSHTRSPHEATLQDGVAVG